VGRALVIAGSAVVLAFMVFVLVVWWRKHNARREDIRVGRPVHGDLTARQERKILALLDDYDRATRELGAGDPMVQDVDYITTGSKNALADLRRRYLDIKGSVERA